MSIYIDARRRMIEYDISRRGIVNEKIINAMSNIPRETFVAEEYRDVAYSDRPLPIGYGQTISQPYIVALMIEMLNPSETDTVLEIGTGCGYQTAILASLVEFVYSIELIPELAVQAQETLESLNISNTTIINSDGSLGWEERAQYQSIILSAAAPEIPRPLFRQLADGGTLVAPVGMHGQQRLEKWTRWGNKYQKDSGIFVSFVPLLGKFGISN